jgi:acetolactate synthase-1/2/3 large subunit
MRLTGGELIAEYLIKEKVPYVFAVPGHGNVAFLDAFHERRDKIKVMGLYHEQSLVHAADAYYRVSGQPCVASTSIGPGAANTVVGVAQAYVDSTAVLLITGSVHTYMRGHGVLQEIEREHWANFPRILEPVVKRWWQPSDVSQLSHVIHRAFNEMLSGRRGPVLVDLPMDLQAAPWEGEVPEPSSALSPPHSDPQLVSRAAQLLYNAERPVIIVGGGVVTANAERQLRTVAEYVGAAVTTTWNGKGAFPEDHPLYAWHPGDIGASCANELTRNADVVLAVGTRFVDWLASSYRKGVTYNIPPTKLIQIDIDHGEIGKNYPVEIGLEGDANAALSDLVDALEDVGKPKDWRNAKYTRHIGKLVQEWWDSFKERRESNDSPISISRALAEMRQVLDRDAIVVTGAGLPQSQVYQEFPVYETRTHIQSGGFSTMGFTVPGTIGAALAAPKRGYRVPGNARDPQPELAARRRIGREQVVGIAGDGDFLSTMQELGVAVQHDLPIVYVIFNNMGWQSIKNLQQNAYGKDRVMITEFLRKGEPYSPNFSEVAIAFGAYSVRIDRPDQVKDALKGALRSGQTAVVEMMTSRTAPNSGLSKVGWWDVPIPAYLKDRREVYERERAEEQLT